MKVLYSVKGCGACMARYRQLKEEGVKFKYVVIPEDMPSDVFFAKYPDVKSVPFEVEEEEDNGN